MFLYEYNCNKYMCECEYKRNLVFRIMTVAIFNQVA